MPVIRVSESTKKELLRYAAELLLMACSPAPSPEEVVRELYEERGRDEKRAKRKYCVFCRKLGWEEG
ncbi:MAG: hypothetical protein DRK00_09110 [Thermoprotei archaeon]|nr:MAG: hypothetical protein DRK00_09110 [Thermoprotei archaeon]